MRKWWPLAVLALPVLLPGTAAAGGWFGWRIVIGAPPDPYYRESMENGQVGPPGYSPGYGYYPYGNLPSLVITNRPPPPVEVTVVQQPIPHATLRVLVPPDAEVWFWDQKTTQSGAERLYLTPDLEQSGAYGYEIRARWKQDGKPIERTRKVIVHPGNRVTVDFLGLEGKE
jgi:uncharacterized protein (TIGR03000 family)